MLQTMGSVQHNRSPRCKLQVNSARNGNQGSITRPNLPHSASYVLGIVLNNVTRVGLHTAKGEVVRYHNRYQRNDTVF